MQKFTTLTSTAVPLPIKDVDTDMIIPADFLTSTSKQGYGENLFRRLKDQDENFPLNLEKFKDAKILIGDENFGCGSSREHAAWAILEAGFQVVIAKDFADIFSNNAAKNGLLLITLPEHIVDEILEESESGKYEITVNLEKQKVQLANGDSYHFDYDPFRKHCLEEGLDDINYILAYKNKIKEKAENNTIFFRP